MRILHLYKDYFPVLGGIENHIRDLARLQTARGHDVTVLVTGPDPRTVEWRDAGVRVLQVPRLAVVASTPLSLEFVRVLRGLEADIAHLHFPYPVAEAAQMAVGRAQRTVVTYHADIVRQRVMLALYGPLLKRMLRRADRLIATSEPYIRTSEVLRPFAEKTTAIPLGIDPRRFRGVDAAAVAALRRRLGGGDELLFVSVGRFRYYKGLPFAIRAIAATPGTRLALVGSGPLEVELRALVAELGVEDRVVFAGTIPDEQLPLWFAAGDAYVSSASHRAEAFGISILEAMASGKPIISTELGTGTSFVNQHGETGLVVTAADADALAGAMATLRDDPAARRRFGEAASARVDREFTLERMTDRVLRVYEEVSGRPRGDAA